VRGLIAKLDHLAEFPGRIHVQEREGVRRTKSSDIASSTSLRS
jgi:hypothetical protein